MSHLVAKITRPPHGLSTFHHSRANSLANSLLTTRMRACSAGIETQRAVSVQCAPSRVAQQPSAGNNSWLGWPMRLQHEQTARWPKCAVVAASYLYARNSFSCKQSTMGCCRYALSVGKSCGFYLNHLNRRNMTKFGHLASGQSVLSPSHVCSIVHRCQSKPVLKKLHRHHRDMHQRLSSSRSPARRRLNTF